MCPREELACSWVGVELIPIAIKLLSSVVLLMVVLLMVASVVSVYITWEKCVSKASFILFFVIISSYLFHLYHIFRRRS